MNKKDMLYLILIIISFLILISRIQIKNIRINDMELGLSKQEIKEHIQKDIRTYLDDLSYKSKYKYYSYTIYPFKYLYLVVIRIGRIYDIIYLIFLNIILLYIIRKNFVNNIYINIYFVIPTIGIVCVFLVKYLDDIMSSNIENLENIFKVLHIYSYILYYTEVVSLITLIIFIIFNIIKKVKYGVTAHNRSINATPP